MAQPPLTPEQLAQRDLMLMHLREAVRLGYVMATPGNGVFGDAVRAAYPDLFALPANMADIPTSDELELDDHPMVSWGDEGCFVQTWSWVEKSADDDEPEADDDEALMPDGTRCPWDERLRTVGALRVPKEG